MKISKADKAILRELARKQQTYANCDKNLETIEQWYRHHRFEKGRPMIHLELETFKHEVIEPRLQCETEIGRKIESTLYDNFLNFELFGDDRVVPDYFPIMWDTYFHLFDQKIKVVKADKEHSESVGHQFQHVIKNLKEDYHILKESTFGVDREGTLAYKEIVEDAIGDIIPVKMIMSGLYAVPTQKLVHIMGMETLLFSMYDYPELFKEMMDRVANDYITYYNWLESEGLLLPTTSNQPLGQGTWCYTDELPDYEKLKGRSLKTQDVWGFMDSQESVGISPDMFNEFIFPCYEKISKAYGLLSYGCCEAVDPVWEKSISKLKNLRKVSISPWCNQEYMGEQLKGKHIIFHRKPSPNTLGVDKVLNEDKLREHINETLKAAKGCQLEITQRDVYTIHNNENKARRYIEIIREEIEKNW